MSNNCVISVCAVQNDAIFNATAKGNLHCFGVALWRQPRFESLTLNVVFVNKLWDFSFLLRVVKLALIVAKTWFARLFKIEKQMLYKQATTRGCMLINHFSFSYKKMIILWKLSHRPSKKANEKNQCGLQTNSKTPEGTAHWNVVPTCAYRSNNDRLQCVSLLHQSIERKSNNFMCTFALPVHSASCWCSLESERSFHVSGPTAIRPHTPHTFTRPSTTT